MLVLGNIEISLLVYLKIGVAISLIVCLYKCYKDSIAYDGIGLISVIYSICDGLIIGLGWIFSVPLSLIFKMILSGVIMDEMLAEKYVNTNEEEDENESKK